MSDKQYARRIVESEYTDALPSSRQHLLHQEVIFEQKNDVRRARTYNLWRASARTENQRATIAPGHR